MQCAIKRVKEAHIHSLGCVSQQSQSKIPWQVVAFAIQQVSQAAMVHQLEHEHQLVV